MRNLQKIISILLALFMLVMASETLFVLPAFADEPADTSTAAPADASGEEEEEKEKLPDYTQIIYNSAQEKVDSIQKGFEYDFNGKYLGGKNIWTKYGDSYLYVDAFSGEVVWHNTKTGEMLFTNPWDVAHKDAATNRSQREQLLSQIELSFQDKTGTSNTINSYVEACQREQISVRYITNGVRVEYSMGEEEGRKLVPRLIEKSRFESLILNKVEGRDKAKLEAYYMPYGPNNQSEEIPVSKTMDVYGFDQAASKRQLSEVEAIIEKTGYTFDDLNEDHAITNYQGSDAAPAVFKFGLEYTLRDDGSMTVRLAANGIRYDEDNYQLTSISILPYFGATNNKYQGYTFLADGSGALIENSDTQYNLSGKVYGIDYAYHQITGANQEVMRLPVFGVTQYTADHEKVEVSNVDQMDESEVTTPEDEPEEGEPGDEEGEPNEEDGENDDGDSTPANADEEDNTDRPANDFGYFAVIEEGASLATILSSHGGPVYKYSSVYTRFMPRASDTYDLSNSLSVGGTSYTVQSKRKYTGSYTLRYYMLTDDGMAKAAGVSEDDYYKVSYVGMAKAYQNYLESTGVITKLNASDTGKDLPLYIESFGTLDTQDTFLSIPVTVKTPLTTFDDLKSMYDQVAEKGITNINFRLRGFINGGMTGTVPYKVKFESKAGGNSGFKDLLAYAQEKGFCVYPEFEFSYVSKTEAFDGFDMKKQAVRTIDSRYTLKREYDAVFQRFVRIGEVAISPASIPDIYEGFIKNYEKNFDKLGISVGSLGSDLNSDFDRKDPYDRNDSQLYISEVLDRIDEDFGNVMIDGGNSFAIRAADHILNISLDSSRYAKASKSVPFMAMVLHGYVQYAGTPTNMASDSTYQMLKSIENGSNPYYMLSYRNLAELKESDDFSKYYSVSFKIWLEDMVKAYNTLNENLGSLQTERIVDHEFLKGERDHTAEETASGGNFSTDSGTIVRVEYSDGTQFYINYNDYAVTAEDGQKIPANAFVRI